MPKIVDHEQRRIEIVQASWRIMARSGIDTLTLREIAAEAGYANGAIKPYFATKDELLAFSYEYVFTQTNTRMREVTASLCGLDALRAFCLEILPIDDTKLSEARIVIAFWAKTLQDPAQYQVHEEQMGGWRQSLRGYLTDAIDSGAIASDTNCDLAVGHLMNFVLGAQITATLTPHQQGAAELVEQLDHMLRALRRPRQAAVSA